MSNQHKLFKGNSLAYLALSATCILWGTTWVASKIAISENLPPFQFAAVRQFLGGFCFLLFFLGFKKMPLPSLRQFGWLFILGLLLFVLSNGFSSWSLKYISSGFSCLIGALYPLSVVTIERFFFNKKNLSILTFIGLLLGLSGVGIVFYENLLIQHQEGFYFGVFLSVMAMLSWSVGTMFIAKNKLQLNPYYSAGWQMLISSLVLFIISLSNQTAIPLHNFSLKGWLAIAYLVVFGSIISYIAFVYSMKKLPIAISSLYAYLNPIVAMITAAFVINEKLTVHIFWGALVTLAGVFIVNYSVSRDRVKVIAEPEQ
jgi:drug/metabolite transporter (DMT)-like permease